MPALILSCILAPTKLCVGVYLPRLIRKMTQKVPAMSKVMMVRRIPMTSPTYCDSACSCTVWTLDWVVPVLTGGIMVSASVVADTRSVGLLSSGRGVEASVLNGFSS